MASGGFEGGIADHWRGSGRYERSYAVAEGLLMALNRISSQSEKMKLFRGKYRIVNTAAAAECAGSPACL